MNREKCCCFTGHRLIAQRDRADMESILETLLRHTIPTGITQFYCGGARGFDLLAGFVVLRLKRAFPDVKLIMALPCRDQDARWPQADRAAYRRLMEAADQAIYLADAYDPDCMRRRNLYMVAHSSLCIAYLHHARSGTAQTVRMAEARGLEVHNIARIIHLMDVQVATDGPFADPENQAILRVPR